MDCQPDDIGTSFDARAERYNQNEWHRTCAEELIAFSALNPGARVLDAGTGTGLAAIAAARAVGARGRVVAVDVSSGMLSVARRHVPEANSAPIDWVHESAVDLAGYGGETFDAVVCAAALLYMPVGSALAEWRRLLRPGGTVAVSAMRTGSPAAGRVFRECAATYGFRLVDPSEALGSESACREALSMAGFTSVTVTSITIPFTANDANMAWESNLGSAAHAAVRAAHPEVVAEMKRDFLRALDEEERRTPGSTARAAVLFARGRR